MSEKSPRKLSARLNWLLASARVLIFGGLSLSSTITGHAVTHTWTGAGLTGWWSDMANWQGNSPPQRGEVGINLEFPPGASRLSSSNDMSGLSISQLTFSGNGYVLSGTNALILSLSAGDSVAATSGSNHIALPLLLEATNTFHVATNASLSLSGNLSGPGAFSLKGGGLLALSPAAGLDNTYLGTTHVLEGMLQLDSGRTNDLFGTRFYATAVPGVLVIGATNGVAPAVLRGMAMSPNTDLTLLGAGRYEVIGDLLEFGSLSGDGFVDCQGQSFRVGGNDCSTLFTGQINGRSDAGFQKVGKGTLTLAGGDAGPVTMGILEGKLVVDGNFTNSTAVIGLPLNGFEGGRLEGNGSLLEIIAHGPVSPGHENPGLLATMSAIFDLDSQLIVRLGGTNAGVNYDQLVAGQRCDIVDHSASLQVVMLPGFVGAVGNQYTLVRLDGTNDVGGFVAEFNGLPEGAFLTLAGGAAFQITYHGGDGNDIVLTQAAAQPVLDQPFVLPNGNVVISGIGTAGVTYEVQTNSSLSDPFGWAAAGTAPTPPDGHFTFVHTPSPGLPQIYYRLRAE